MITDELTPHPYAACYPLVSGALEESLYDSIKENGLRQPVVLWRDEARAKIWIIDGRNRYRALEQLQGGLNEDQVIWRSYESDEAVRLAVLDYNENRRQMSTAQKSIVAGKILEARAALLDPPSEESTSETKEALTAPESDDPREESQAQAPSVQSEEIAAPIPPEEGGAPLPSTPRVGSAKPCPPKVRKEVAETLGIGARTAQKGATIVGRGAPKLVSALEEGSVSLEAAYTLTQLDDEALNEVIAQGKEGMREKARALKGLAKDSQDKERREALLGALEIEALQLSWIERGESGEREVNIQVTEPDQLYKLLSTLKRMGLMDAERDG